MELVKKRIDWIDCAKGMTILLVIIGHTITTNSFWWNGIRGAIFSFHMPLFFILSGATFKYSENVKQWGKRICKSSLHLILPAVVAYLIRLLVLNEFSSVKQVLVNFFWASGVDGENFSAIGMVWFLVVLFWVRTIMDLLHLCMNNFCWISVVLLTFFGILIGKITWLPLSLDIAFACLIFFAGGGTPVRYIIEKAIEKKKIWKLFIISGIIYASTYLIIVFITHGYLELACRNYPFYGTVPIFTAFLGTIMVCCFGLIIKNDSENLIFIRIYNYLIFLGQNSLVLLIIHYFDITFKCIWSIFDNNICNIIMRVILDLFLLSIFHRLKSVIETNLKYSR